MPCPPFISVLSVKTPILSKIKAARQLPGYLCVCILQGSFPVFSVCATLSEIHCHHCSHCHCQPILMKLNQSEYKP